MCSRCPRRCIYALGLVQVADIRTGLCMQRRSQEVLALVLLTSYDPGCSKRNLVPCSRLTDIR